MSKHRSRKVKYSNESIGKIKLIKNFLPRPEDLVTKEETVKVTLSLTKDSVKFFKETADSQNTHYQTMIRNLLDQYAMRYRKRNIQEK